MTTEEIKSYTMRISQSTRTELVVITYEIIINYIESAKESLAEEDISKFVFNVNKAKQFLNDLSSNLDFHYKISYDLMRIYMFINKTLVSAIVRKSDDELDVCIKLINNLRESFAKIAPEDKRGNAMPNSEQVYVGLTYGKGSKLNEYSVR